MTSPPLPKLMVVILSLSILLLTLSATPALSQGLTVLLTPEVEAGGFGSVRIEVSAPINTVEFYLESIPLGEYIGGGQGPLTVTFFIPPEIPPGTYTLYVRVIYLTQTALRITTESHQLTIYRVEEPQIVVAVSRVVEPSSRLEGFIYSTLKGNPADAGDITVRLIALSPDGSIVEVATTDAVRVSQGLYTFQLQAPSDPGLYLLIAQASGTSGGTLRISSSATATPLVVAAGAQDLAQVLEELARLEDLITGSRDAVIERIGTAENNITEAVESSKSEVLQQLGLVIEGVQGLSEALDRISSQLVVVSDGVNTIVGIVKEVRDGVIRLETAMGEVTAKVEENSNAIKKVEGEIVEVKTTLGDMAVNIQAILEKVEPVSKDVVEIKTVLGEMKGTIVEVRDGVASIKTDLGDLALNLEEINANIIKMDNDIAVIKGDVGEIKVGVDKLLVAIKKVDDRTVSIETGLGELEGVIVEVKDGIATIRTDVGEIKVSLSRLPATIQDDIKRIEGKVDALSKTSATRNQLEEIKATLEEVKARLENSPTRTGVVTTSLAAGALAGLLVAAAVAIALRRVL